jgi:ABC-type uncharacterized transport system involved in gliding motility auxiliary subunit
MKRSASGMTALAIVLAVVLFVSVNVLAGRFLSNAHIDLTNRQLYTLSDGTRKVLARIEEPISLKFYYSSQLSEALPAYGVYAQRVRELLQEYAALSHGKIDLKILDPAPFSETEDKATADGVQGVPLEDGSEQVYFGLAGTNSTDDAETIPFFQIEREKFLEYDLSKLVQKLASPKQKVVGLVTALPVDGDALAQMQGRQSHPLAVIDQLRQTFDVHDLTVNFDKVPSDVDVLMVVQPEKLPAKTEYAIDQFVLGGGHALVFVDPHSEFQQTHPSVTSPPGSPLGAEFDRMLTAWAVELTKGKIVGDRQSARRVNMGTANRPVAADFIAWLTLKGDSINKSDPVTGQLTSINLASAGALNSIAGAKITFEPLLQSSPDSELFDEAQLTRQPDVVGLMRDFKSTDTRYVFAARVTGPADTAFPDGPPGDEADKTADDKKADAKAAPDQIKTAKQPINLIIVADSDMLDDHFWVRTQDFFGQRNLVPEAGNGDFVQNAVDSLSGTGDLINLRSRGSAVRPFTLVDEIQRDAQDRYQTEEKQLQDKLKDTESKLADVKPQSADGKDSVTPEEQQTIDQFRATIIQTRQQLRQVQLALRQEIDSLKRKLVLLDVGAVPLGVAVVALVVGLLRARRRSKKPAA